LKKLVRAEKKKALKRTHKDLEKMQASESDNNAEIPVKRTVDKEAL